eukprot:3448-Heterococcus_DN1.PRE.1
MMHYVQTAASLPGASTVAVQHRMLGLSNNLATKCLAPSTATSQQAFCEGINTAQLSLEKRYAELSLVVRRAGSLCRLIMRACSCFLGYSLSVACVQIVAGFLPPLILRTHCHRLQLVDEAAAAAAAVAVFPAEEVMQMVPGILINNGEAWRIDEEDGSLYCWRWRQSECVWEANTAVAKSKLPMLASDDDDVCYGLFAMREFAAGETVGYYDGTIIGTCEQLDYSDWLPLYLKDHDKV